MNELVKVKVRYAIVAVIIGFLAGWIFISFIGSEGTSGTGSAETIKFGFLGALTGDVATLGIPMSNAVKLAVEELNAKGGINGKQVEVIFEDGKCSGKDASTAIQKLVQVDKVVGIVGGLCSSETLPSAPIAEAGKVVMLSPSSTSPKIKDAGDFIFRVVPSDAGQGKEAAKIMKESGYTKVGVISLNDEWGAALSGVFKREAQAAGLQVISAETFEPRATDMKTQLTKMKNANPEALYMAAFVTEAAVILKQMAELGLDIPVIAGDAAKDDALFQSSGNAAEGLKVLLPGVPESPELQSFAAAFKAKYGQEYSAYTAESYDAFNILAWACEQSDCTGTGIKDKLYTMPKYTGASGSFEFDEFGEVEKPYDVFVVKNGKFVKEE